MNKKVNIAIADDHNVFRTSLKTFLEKEKNFKVVLEAGTTDEIYNQINNKLDILILDINMPGKMNTSDTAKLILKKFKKIKIIILTMYEDEFYLKEFLKIGVKGFLLKKSSAEQLIEAIKRVYNNEYYIDPYFSQHIADNFKKYKYKKNKKINLTNREIEITRYLALGYTNEEIANKLFISKRTVEKHRSNIMQKLGITTRAQLVKFAIGKKILNIE